MIGNRFADRVLLSRVLSRTIPDTAILAEYHAVSRKIFAGWRPGKHERMIPRHATFDRLESDVVPGGPFTVAIFPRTRLLKSIGPGSNAATINSTKLPIPLIAAPPQLWAARMDDLATFDHEAIHVLQGLRHGAEGRVSLPTLEEAFPVIVHRIQMEFDAYFVEYFHHPMFFAKELATFAAFSGWSTQQLALMQATIAGIEDAASCAFFTHEEMYWPFMELFTNQAPSEFQKWGLAPATVEWWVELSHVRNARIAWDRTADIRGRVGLHRSFSRFFPES